MSARRNDFTRVKSTCNACDVECIVNDMQRFYDGIPVASEIKMRYRRQSLKMCATLNYRALLGILYHGLAHFRDIFNFLQYYRETDRGEKERFTTR